MYRIKEFINHHTFEEPNGNRTILPEIINPEFNFTRNCAVPACESYMSERSMKLLTNTINFKPVR